MKITVMALFLFVFSGYCLAQYSPQYDFYWSITGSANNNLTQTALLDGTTTGSCYLNGGTYYVPNCPSTHEPSITNELGSSNASGNGQSVDMFDYLSYQTTATLAATPGQVYSADVGGSVFCNTAGSNIFSTLFSFHAGASETLYAIATQTCSWNKSCPVGQTATCGVGVIYGTPPCSNFVELYYVWYNFGGGNVCLKSGPALGSSIPVGGCD